MNQKTHSAEESFNYGGQAVIEGVMMRGSQAMAVALRSPTGDIVVETEPLNEMLYRGPISRIPFLRGVVMLWDALGLGMKALMTSADVSVGEEASLSGPTSWGTGAIGIAFGVGLFMLLPSFVAGLLEPVLPVEWLMSVVEGALRLILAVGYIWAIGHMPDIARVFAYHGAEHKTINAYEAGEELTVDAVRGYPKAHLRCGTSFLLSLVVISVLLFAPLNPPSLLWRLVTRLALLPLLAGISYEFIRLTARFADQPWMQWMIGPNLALQRLTTREPDDDMLEVAICALKAVLADEEGAEYAVA
jgi:uncharacterized protein YqhQ